jgi:hypothetical protein
MFYCYGTDELYEDWLEVCVVGHVCFMQRLQSVLVEIIQGALIQIIQGVFIQLLQGVVY